MSLPTIATLLAIIIGIAARLPSEAAPRQMEKLGRGVVAVVQGDGKIYVGWRLFGTDPDAIAFNIYRITGNEKPVKLNGPPILDATSFVDAKPDLTKPNAYFVR